MKMRKPMAIRNAHHRLPVNLTARLYTTVHNANLMAQLIINFQFITAAKVILISENTKTFLANSKTKSRLSLDNRLQKQTT